MPRGGYRAGLFVTGHRLKHVFQALPQISYRTVQRYLSGHPVRPEAEQLIIKTIVNALIPMDADAFSHRFFFRVFNDSILKFDLTSVVVNHMRRNHLRSTPPPIIQNLMQLDLADVSQMTVQQTKEQFGPFVQENCAQWIFPFIFKMRNDSFIKEIDERRTKAGLTLEDLAHAVGISTQALTQWRAGIAQPTHRNIVRLAKALHNGQPLWLVELRFRTLVAYRDNIPQLQTVCRDIWGHPQHHHQIDNTFPVLDTLWRSISNPVEVIMFWMPYKAESIAR